MISETSHLSRLSLTTDGFPHHAPSVSFVVTRYSGANRPMTTWHVAFWCARQKWPKGGVGTCTSSLRRSGETEHGRKGSSHTEPEEPQVRYDWTLLAPIL